MEATKKPIPVRSPHLTTEDLAARWHCTKFTISKKYRLLGLRPITVGKRLLFPVGQVEEAERRSMVGEVA